MLVWGEALGIFCPVKAWGGHIWAFHRWPCAHGSVGTWTTGAKSKGERYGMNSVPKITATTFVFSSACFFFYVIKPSQWIVTELIQMSYSFQYISYICMYKIVWSLYLYICGGSCSARCLRQVAGPPGRTLPTPPPSPSHRYCTHAHIDRSQNRCRLENQPHCTVLYGTFKGG